jgi:hypothetical protein
MGEEDLGSYGAFLKVMGHYVVTELSNAAAGVNNDQPVQVLETQF